MKKKVELSVILPVHNEEKGIQQFLTAVLNEIRSNNIISEVICVENGSKDNSYQILKSLEKTHPEITVIRSQTGWGNAVRKGIKKAGGSYVLYMVSDGQVDAKYISKSYNLILKENVDMIKVSRTTRENTARLINSRLYNFLARRMFGFESIDINGTPKIGKVHVFKNFSFHSHNITFDLELLLKMKRYGYRWIEIPIKSKKRLLGVSTTNVKSAYEMLSYMVLSYMGAVK